MSQWRLGFKLLRREGFNGELRWFVLALALSVACVLSVALVADRLDAGLKASGRDFIGADRALRSATPAPAAWLEQAAKTGLAVQTTVSFNSMLFHGDALQLASIRAVPEDFPFYGKLELSPQRAPAPGEIWLSARVMQLLAAKPGDELEVGNTVLKVAGVLGQEPDQGFSPFLLAPRALIHSADVEATGALLPGSRQQWRYLFKGSREQVADYERWLKPRLKAGQKLIKPDDQGSQVGRSLANAERFFRLASLAGVLLGALAMGIAVRHFAERQTNMVALLKTLGASRRSLWQLMGTLLLSLTLVGALLGLVAGSAMQWLTLHLLGNLLPADLPPPSWRPFALGLAVAFFITLLLAFVPFLRLLKVPPLRVLRRELEAGIPPWLALPVALLGLFGLVWGFTADATLALGLIGGMGLLMGLLALIASLLLRLGRRVQGPHALRLAISHLSRERGSGLFQLAGFALALMLFGLLWAARVDLLGEFSARLPADAPNRFLVNVADGERGGILADLRQAGAVTSDFYPMVRGRLVSIASEAVRDTDEDGREGVNRELNFTTTATLPPDNTLTAGRWLDGPGQVSVDKDLAKRLDIALGDTLGFTIEGHSFKAQVTSLRAIKWDNMRPNFYMIFSPDVLAPFSQTWLGSYRLPEQGRVAEVELIRRHPTVSLIDVDDLIVRLTAVSDQVSRALGLMLGLVTVAALLVLLTQTQASMAHRRRELLLMRTLGAGSELLRKMLRWELVASGLLAGLCAAMVVELCSLGLQWWWFEGQWQFHWAIWIGLPLLGAVLVTLAGQGMQRQLLAGTLSDRLRGLGQGLL
ncbi:ABC transporter permease [Aeromonas hydrophila]|uniref:ABC-type transport system, permease component n=1 Tax=Aeromonas hydrophila subsp. hydrophila (strain ATCC 7966 / DSM 30187 / BCRC 13018 / CCUG 14551 / JCM 1027 / KCTC 2358 / NCIMB 9240 / NCTC 8049) TaxID=380703 RepID=A0KNW0_AERHH|nr:FtsX-like permease family protein [Aeromonas hydrophila]ABK36828.1 ABC-type transport system, permease component [Aeromonas hydrophila subsp. hydrophila ATCC 7966]EHA1069152.1 FtsX-like permease family protein [Aeromonas hydrophila]MBM0439696.1 FtsX-like permease family protein [Aeromonas hydrophila subsp. ranae]MBS4671618.1 FtsX-like permease family protein [Aeromonas hydrophila]MBW3828242.1 FtsX-like permease family protein [Aeromonas hydrophila]